MKSNERDLLDGNYSVPHCNCGTELEFYTSPCIDFECCSIANEIECPECHMTKEFWDYNGYHDAWIKLGGRKEDLYE